MPEAVKGTLQQRIKRTSTVQSFRFATESRLNFIPGQFIEVIFDKDNPGDKTLNKYLSFSSSPDKDYIEVTKKLTESAFSQSLKNLRIGDKILFRGPLGNCVFKEEYKKIGFLIGGIGITPVIAIIEYIIDRKLDTDVVVAYSNRTEGDIAFGKELSGWAKLNPGIKVYNYITDCPAKGPNCFSGPITPESLSGIINDWEQRVIFIFGPPKMVITMQNLCLSAGCANARIKVESFLGY